MADNLTDEIKELNDNARLLLSKYDGVFSKLSQQKELSLEEIELLKNNSIQALVDKREEGLNSIQSLINNGAGKVLQVKTFQVQPTNDNYTLIGDGVNFDTQVKMKITPKRADSKLIILAEHQVRFIEAYGISAGLKRDGNYVTPARNRSGLFFAYKGDSVNHHTQALVHTSVPSNNTNETEFLLFVSPYGGTAEVNNGWGNRYIMIMEVAE